MKTSSKVRKDNPELVEIVKQIRFSNGEYDPLKNSANIKKLSDEYKMNPTDIANRCNISVPNVYNNLRLSGLPPKVKAYIKDKKIPSTVVLKMLRKRMDPNVLIKKVEDRIQKDYQKSTSEAKIQEKEKKFKERSQALVKETRTTVTHFTGGKRVPNRTIDEIVNFTISKLAM